MKTRQPREPHNVPIIIRLTKTEKATLASLALSSGMCEAALVRFILHHAAANGLKTAPAILPHLDNALSATIQPAA